MLSMKLSVKFKNNKLGSLKRKEWWALVIGCMGNQEDIDYLVSWAQKWQVRELQGNAFGGRMQQDKRI